MRGVVNRGCSGTWPNTSPGMSDCKEISRVEMNIRGGFGSLDSRISIDEFDSFWNEVLVLFLCAREEK